MTAEKIESKNPQIKMNFSFYFIFSLSCCIEKQIIVKVKKDKLHDEVSTDVIHSQFQYVQNSKEFSSQCDFPAVGFETNRLKQSSVTDSFNQKASLAMIVPGRMPGITYLTSGYPNSPLSLISDQFCNTKASWSMFMCLVID